MSPTKLETIFWKRNTPYSFLELLQKLFYEVVAKFRKTKFFCNRQLTGYENSLVVDWGKRFRDDAVVSPQKAPRKQLKTMIIDFAPAGKQKLGLAKSSRSYKVLNLCAL